MRTTSAVLLVAMLVAACGGGGDSGDDSDRRPGAGITPVTADITVLYMGNSHTTSNNLPDMIAAMVRAAKPTKTFGYAVAPGSDPAADG